jgi:GNAT superfamily N-acetyltransferase
LSKVVHETSIEDRYRRAVAHVKYSSQVQPMTYDVTVRRVRADQTLAHVDALADILIDCVEAGASVSFMLPITRAKALSFWHGIAAAVARHERALLIAEADGQLVGTVQLLLALPENQPHRAEVAKMLVPQSARRRGIGLQLMAALEHEARNEGRTVLVLDTVTGQAGERLYERAGYHRVGIVPDYALMPDGELCATTFFFKHL